MLLIVPFAAPLSEGGRQTLRSLALPGLRALLPLLAETARDPGDAGTWSPPHERALAAARGWNGGDGLLPFAAAAAAADGIDCGDLAWGLLTPSHWQVGSTQVTLADPAALALDEAASRALFDAVEPLFTSRGFAVRWGAPLRWYAAHESLAALATASIDRVVGRGVDAWLGASDDPAQRRMRALQNEAQMLLYEHPVNAEREAAGLLPVNSFWLSGCGVAQPVRTEPVVDDRLRVPALADDWAAWAAAWQELDAGPIAAMRAAAQGQKGKEGEELTLILCGELAAVTLTAAPAASRGWIDRLRRRWAAPVEPAAWLDSL